MITKNAMLLIEAVPRTVLVLFELSQIPNLPLVVLSVVTVVSTISKAKFVISLRITIARMTVTRVLIPSWFSTKRSCLPTKEVPFVTVAARIAVMDNWILLLESNATLLLMLTVTRTASPVRLVTGPLVTLGVVASSVVTVFSRMVRFAILVSLLIVVDPIALVAKLVMPLMSSVTAYSVEME